MLCHKVATFLLSFALCRRSGRHLPFALREVEVLRGAFRRAAQALKRLCSLHCPLVAQSALRLPPRICRSQQEILSQQGRSPPPPRKRAPWQRLSLQREMAELQLQNCFCGDWPRVQPARLPIPTFPETKQQPPSLQKKKKKKKERSGGTSRCIRMLQELEDTIC